MGSTSLSAPQTAVAHHAPSPGGSVSLHWGALGPGVTVQAEKKKKRKPRVYPSPKPESFDKQARSCSHAELSGFHSSSGAVGLLTDGIAVKIQPHGTEVKSTKNTKSLSPKEISFLL